MLFLYIFILLVALYGVSFSRDGFNQGYIGKEQCNAIKGIFILIVFVRHIWPYLSKSGYDFSAPGDTLFIMIDRGIGQLLVVAFLFYSGFGVMESIKYKGKHYVDSMPRKRMLTTLVNFDIAVSLFLIMKLILGMNLSLQKTILAFTGWTSIGNSNWYIFIVIVCYFCTWLSFKLDKKWLFVFLFGAIYIILVNTKKSYWYNTMLAFPAGLFYSHYKVEIEHFIQKRYWMVLITCIATFICAYFLRLDFSTYGIKDNIVSVLFALTIVIISMKVNVGNKALIWVGLKLFPIYIYQRLPMIALKEFDNGQFVSQHPYLYICICFLITLIIAYAFRSVSFENIKKKGD